MSSTAVYLAAAVPYDFDFTGLVDASYAIPDDKITGTTSIRERIFLGVCRSREVYQKDLEEFLEKKEEFYRLINEFPYLNEKQKREHDLLSGHILRTMHGKAEDTECVLKQLQEFLIL